MNHLTIYILLKYYRLARICDGRHEIKSSKSSYYIFLSLVEIYRKFYPISFRFVRFRFVAFRFYFVSHFTGTQLNKPQLTKNKQQHFIGIRVFDSRLYLDISRSFKLIFSIVPNVDLLSVWFVFTCGRFVSYFCIARIHFKSSHYSSVLNINYASHEILVLCLVYIDQLLL